MGNWINRNFNTIIRITYIIPILLVAAISLAHVVSWYELTNPISWAIYLSIGIEIAALSALAGMNIKNVTKFIYVPFIIVTLIQLMGNIFFAYQWTGKQPEMLTDWISLMNPIFEAMGTVDGESDIIGHRRMLAILGGGLLPLISLSFMELLVRFNKNLGEEIQPNKPTIEPEPESTIEPELESTPEPVQAPEPETELILDDHPVYEEDNQIAEPVVEEPVVEEPTPITEVIPEVKKKVEFDRIKEVQESRGFSRNIPKNKNQIERIGQNKQIDLNNPSQVTFKRNR
jgi:hypothetical protein